MLAGDFAAYSGSDAGLDAPTAPEADVHLEGWALHKIQARPIALGHNRPASDAELAG
jgi:hypothetical protein